MNHIHRFTSDPRFLLITKRAEEEGWQVSCGSDLPDTPCVFLFSLRTGDEELKEAMAHAKNGSLAVVGKAAPETVALLNKRGIGVLPLLQDPNYRTENALATAEGVLSEVIAKTDRLLSEQCVLVCGYGNCGKAIARLLWLCGCEVWILSRAKSRKKAEEEGFNTLPQGCDRLGMFDLIVNTVEDAIFTEKELNFVSPGCRFLQVASGFSGLCAETLLEKGIRFDPLPGLPGRYAAASEADTIYRLIRARWKEGGCEK